MDLTFLSSAMLWGALAASVPILIHLLVQRPPRRIIFPPLLFLTGTASRIASGMKIKRWLLLAARAAIILALALLMARGMVLPGSASGDSPSAVGIVIDNSPSMLLSSSSGTLLDRAVRVAREIVSSSPPGTLFAVSGMGGPRDLVRDPEAARTLIEQNAIPYLSKGLAAPIRAMHSLFSTLPADQPKVIWIISDLAATNFASAELFEEVENTSVKFIDLDSSVPADRAVLAVEPLSPIFIPGLPVTVAARLYSTQELVSQTVELRVHDKVVDSRTTDLRPDEVATVVFEFTPDKGDAGISGSVSFVTRDAFTNNDSASFALGSTRRPEVLVACDEVNPRNRRAGLFVANALSPSTLGDGAPFRVTRVANASLVPTALDAPDAFFLLSHYPPPEPVTRRLTERVQKGAALFLFASPSMRFSEFQGWSGLPAIDSVPAYLADPVGLSAVSPRNSLVEFFSSARNGRLDMVLSMARAPLQKLPDGTRLLLEYEDGVPAAFSWTMGQGMCVMFNLSLEDGESNLLRRPVFLPLLHELMRLALPAARAKTSFIYGEDTIRITVPPATKSVELRQTGGRSWSPEVDPVSRTATLGEPLAPGVYSVWYDNTDKPSGSVTVNWPAEEMKLARASRDRIAAMFPNSVFVSPGSFGVAGGAGAFDLNLLVLPLLLMFFVGELWLANTFFKAAPQPTGTPENNDAKAGA